jgi:hypothetical protein
MTITLTNEQGEKLMEILESSYQKPTTDANVKEKEVIELIICQILGQLP